MGGTNDDIKAIKPHDYFYLLRKLADPKIHECQICVNQ